MKRHICNFNIIPNYGHDGLFTHIPLAFRSQPGIQKQLAIQTPVVSQFGSVPKSGFAQVPSHCPKPHILYRSRFGQSSKTGTKTKKYYLNASIRTLFGKTSEKYHSLLDEHKLHDSSWRSLERIYSLRYKRVHS